MWPPRSVAAHFLAVPPVWYTDGDHTKAVARNITSWLPEQVQWATAETDAGPWTDFGEENLAFLRCQFLINTIICPYRLGTNVRKNNGGEKKTKRRVLAGTTSRTDWWEREVYDIRTEIYAQELHSDHSLKDAMVVGTAAARRPKFLRMTAKSAAPPWWAEWQEKVVQPAAGLREGRLVLDELIVGFE